MSILRSFFYGTMTIAMLAFVGVNSARATIILSEDFETTFAGGTPTVPSTYTATTSNIFKTTVSGATYTYTDNATAGITFTGSKYLKYDDAASGPVMRSRFTTSPLSKPAITGVFQYSWDYYEPNDLIAGTSTHTRFLLANGDPATATNRAIDLLLVVANDGVSTTGTINNWNGTSVVFSANTLVHFDVIGNVGASTTYIGGDLPTQTFDLYMNGNLVGNNLIFRAGNDPTVGAGPFLTSINEMGVGYNSGGATRVQRSYIDNILLQDHISVPEPSTYLLAGMGLVGLGLVRKRGTRNV